MSATKFIELDQIVKSYGHVMAVRGVDFSADQGEVIGLIGANGAGKSTLNKIISGSVQPDSGTIEVLGEEVSFGHPRDALAAGIALVPQELSLIEGQSVSENLFAGRLPQAAGFVRRRELRARAREALDRIGLPDVDPDQPAGTLTPVEQRLVTIAEAVSKSPRMLILDEPTAALPSETALRLEPLIARLAEEGTTVLYVSHRLNEVKRIAHRVFAMRDGRHAGDLRGEEITVSKMVELVGGSALKEEPKPSASALSEARVVVTARNVTGNQVVDANLEIRAGEIVGIGGLQGSGRSELLRLVAGVQPIASGELDVLGAGMPRNPAAAVKAGVGYIPEGRKAMVFPSMSVQSNATIAALRDISRLRMFLNAARERSLTTEIADRVRLVGSLESPIGTLSGGNQQKACMSRLLLKGTHLLVLDEPTVGIDVHGRAEIHTLLRELAAEHGAAILVACSEPEELVLLCHRVVVMVEGRIAKELSAPFNEDEVVSASYADAETIDQEVAA